MTIRRVPRWRQLALAVLTAAGLVAAGAGPATAGTGPGAPPTYLALGDSVPFGYYNSPYNPQTDFVRWRQFYSDPTTFRSYADDVAADRHLKLVNASCPGETTGSFIDGQGSNGCENAYRLSNPLHVAYDGTQLAFAEEFLRTHRNVRLVTLQLGANDGFICQATTPDGCTSPAELQAVAAQVAGHLDTILTDLRATGYRGPIDVVDYYALNYADRQGVTGTLVLDHAIDAAAIRHRDPVVSGFAAFLPIAWLRGAGDSRAAGLVRPAPDVHPTPYGHRVLATAVELAPRY